MGIITYIATTEFNAADIFRPRRFAQTAVEKRINQWLNNIPCISSIEFPTMTNRNDCIAEKIISTNTLELM